MGFAFGSQVSLYYAPEDARGTPLAGQWRYPSDGVENFTLTPTNAAEIIHTMSQPDAQGTVDGQRSYSMSFDYILQRHGTTAGQNTLITSLEYYAQTRGASSGTLKTLTFCVCPTSSTTLLCKGGVIESWNVKAGAGEKIVCSVNLQFSAVSTSWTEIASGYASPKALGTTFETMNNATLTKSSLFTNGVANFDATINNGAETLHKIGSVQPASVCESKENVTGNFDMFLESTGTVAVSQLYNSTTGDIVFSSGNSTTAADASMKFTFTNARLTSVPITSSTNTTALQSNIGWLADGVTLAIHS